MREDHDSIFRMEVGLIDTPALTSHTLIPVLYEDIRNLKRPSAVGPVLHTILALRACCCAPTSVAPVAVAAAVMPAAVIAVAEFVAAMPAAVTRPAVLPAAGRHHHHRRRREDHRELVGVYCRGY
jgi:hypothetical protein